MPRLHIIIGDANTRKSSLLRCLTGVQGGRSTNQNMDVALTNGAVINVHCLGAALQESQSSMAPDKFIQYVGRLTPMPNHFIERTPQRPLMSNVRPHGPTAPCWRTRYPSEPSRLSKRGKKR